jgi:hypothetical protein
MKIFWVFANDHYYPGFGLDDLIGTFETREEAEECEKEYKVTRTYGSYSTRIIDISQRLQNGTLV